MAEQLWDIAHPGIYMNGSGPFIAACIMDLNLIRGAGNGANSLNLLSLISKRCQGIGAGNNALNVVSYRVVIKEALSIGGTQAQPNGDDDYLKNGPGAANFKMHGIFAASEVFYLPNQQAAYTNLLGIVTPPYIALAHELIHAFHSLNGDLRFQYGGVGNNSGLLHEEARTVGLGIYAKTRISENAFRRRDNIQIRTYYSSANDCDNLVSIM
jgi:hypothetical protein